MPDDPRPIRVIVTGASSGIGRALAEEFSRCGWELLLVARRQERLKELNLSLADPARIHWIAGDITQAAVQQRVQEFVADTWHRVDVLVNNAGIGSEGAFAKLSPHELRQIFEVNFFAPVELTRLLLPWMKPRLPTEAATAKTGRKFPQALDPMIVNIGSVLGHRAIPWKAAYCASKFAMHGFCDAMRGELLNEGIRILHVCPSTTQTEFFSNLLHDDSPSGAVRRGMSPRYVAHKTLQAMKRGQSELILPWSAKLVVWADRIFPTLSDKLVQYYSSRHRREHAADRKRSS